MDTMTQRLTQPILLVEDNPEDIETTIRSFRKAGVANSIYCCKIGDHALDFLYRRGKYTDPEQAPRPGVILLDLNLPGLDGRDVLKKIKADPDLKRIPVIILSTSSDERDIENCYEHGANSYIIKPVDLIGYIRAIALLKGYWFEIVVLPKSGGNGE